MAKKKRELSDAQYQKMYGRPKSTSNKAGTNTKSQSSASSKSVSSGFTVGYRRSSSGTSGGSRGSSSSSSNNRISSGFTVGYRANNSRRANAPTSRNITSQDRGNQRSYGATRRDTAPTAAYRQRTAPATAEEMRRQNLGSALERNKDPLGVQKQKDVPATAREMMAERKASESIKAQNAKEWERVKNTSKEEQQAWFTKKAQEAQQRRTGKVEKGTDNLATSAAKSAFHGAKGAVHSLYGALTRASLQVENETQRDKALAALRGEDVNQAESVAREKAKKRQDLKLAGIRAKTKAEQEKVEEIKEAEAAKDKGPIPLRKMAVGAASFTGQRVVDTALLGPYSLASMGARVLEDERNAGQEKNERLKKRLAESGQFTQEELDEEFKRMDRRSVANAYASSGIEILSELMFGGIGLSKKYMPEGTRGILDKTVGKLFGNIGKTSVGRLGLGIAEETAEEWIANPVQARVSNMLTGNRLQSLQEESVRREYQKQAMDLKEMQATSADINSDAFLERAKEIYKESGATDKEASRIAELARDYFNADIIGDSDTAEAKLAEITSILAGGENDLREKWTLKDALEVAGEMILSVGAEGFAGAISSSAAGNEYKAKYGIEGVKRLAKVVENLDADKSDRAKAIIDDIDNGKDLTGTQVSQIMEWSNETALKARDREITRDNLVQNRMKDEKLFVPIVDSEYNLSPATDARFEEISDRVVDNIDNMGIKMSDVDAYAIADVVAAYETGTISAEQMNELNVENPEARAVFERETGINLDQYTVKDKMGNIKVAESNIKMQKALFSNAADNYMASARIEQENWNNVERGRAAESLTSDMDGMGGVGIQRVLESVDPRNRGDFMLAGSVARRVYDHARLTNDSWEDVRKDFKNAFPGATMDESMRYVYDMAKRTKAIAETKYYGKQVSNKQSLADSETMYVPGNFTNNSERMLGNTELSTLTNMATTLGVNIVMSDNMANKNANGSYDSSTRTITLNADKSMGEMLQFVLAHEVTHHLAAYAPDEYLKLSRFVMDRAYKADADKFEAAIKNIQKKYKDQAKQDLTPEQALEEIIADNAHEFWQDEAFINDVTSEEPTLAQSIINAIKDILKKLRSVLASGNITDENDRQFLFDEIDSYDQTYKLWTNAFRVARDSQANLAIDNWQDDVNERYSLGYHAGDLGTARFSISKEQDAEYMKAVESGDMETAQRMVDEMAQREGFDYRVFHGATADFTVFDRSKGGQSNKMAKLGHWFTGSQEGAQSWAESIWWGDSDAHVYDSYIKLKNPKIYETPVETEEIRKKLDDINEAITEQEQIMRAINKKYEDFWYTRDKDHLKIAFTNSALAYKATRESAVDSLDNMLKGWATVDLSQDEYKELRKDVESYFDAKEKLGELNLQHGELYYNDAYEQLKTDLYKLAGMTAEDANFAGIGKDMGAYANKDANEVVEELRQKLIDEGYDGVIIKNTRYDASVFGDINTQYVVFNPEQIKLADPVTYDDNGNVIPLSKRFDMQNPDIRYSLDSDSGIINTLKENFDEYKEDETNLRIATEALDDLQRVRFALSESSGRDVPGRWDGGVQVRTIGKGITTSLLNEGRVDFRGQTVETPEDLAKLCQVLRDPRFETFRVVLTKGDKIVSFRSISSRLPGVSAAFELDDIRESIDLIKNRMDRLGADGYYLIHNHPSGDVNASYEDLNVTRAYLALLGQNTYKGHIILDHDEYGYIDADIPQQIHGDNFPTPRIETITGQQTIDFIHEPEMDHPVLGSQIKDSGDVAKVAQTINSEGDVSVLIYTSSKASVRGVQEISNKALKNNKEIGGYIRNQAIDEFGSPAVFLYTTDLDTYNASKKLIESGHLVDSVIGYGTKNGATESGRANVAEPGKIGQLGLTDEQYKRGKVVFESAAGADNYSSLKYSITPKMDADYMAAVESNNMEEAQRLVEEAAEAAGYNEYVFHGTGGEFTEFDESKSGANHGNWSKYGKGFYFSDSEDTANYWGNNRKMIKAYIKLKNPYIIIGLEMTSEGPLFEAFNKLRRRQRLTTREEELDDYMIAYLNEKYGKDYTTNLLKEHGYDGIIVEHPEAEGRYSAAPWSGTIEYIVFDANNIKSAEAVTFDDDLSIIPLSERFNPENKDIRYSLPTTDADGRVLSDGQMEYFKNSQARDEQGRLLKLYHGSESAGFTVFDPSYGISSRAFFLVDSNDRAKGYSGTHDIFQARNPQSIDEVNEYINSIGNDDVAQQDGDEFVILENGQEIIRADNLSDLIIEYDDYTGIGGGAANYEVYLNIENPLVVDAQGNSWESIPFEGDIVTSNWIAEYAQSLGYDGVIINNVYDYGIYASQREQKPQTDYIVFNSNQIKDVNNLNPTENPDIRYSFADEDEAKSKIAYEDAIDNSFEALEYYEQRLADLTDEAAENRPIKKFSEDRITEFYAGLKADDSVPYSDYVLEEDRVRMAQSKNDYFNNINAKWNDRWTTDGEVLNVKSVKTDVRNLIMGVMSNSDTDSKYKRELVNKTLFDIRTAYQLMKQDRPEVASALLYHSAQRMIDNVEFYVDDTFDQYKELRNYLRNTRISVGEDYWSDVDYDAFRKRNFGRLKLVKGRTNVDQVYQELEEMFPEWFNEEETMTVPDQLLQIEHVLDSVQPYKEAYSSEAAAELAFDIADDLYEIMVNGDEVRSLADTYKQRYDAKTKAMKQRHAEAMLRVRRARDEGIQAERAKWRAREEARKEKTAHRKEFDSIQKSYKTLTDRLLSNTADSNIPEQYKKDLAKLLAAFDLQTVGSKKREARTGQKAQKTIRLEAMKTALKSIENRTDDFYLNDSITDIIDSLLGLDSSNPSESIEGKTLDALNASELNKIDKLLKALVHEFNTYKNVRINARNQQAQDIADAQVSSALDHADKFGPGNDWHGIPGGIDRLLNMDEVTPAYLFRQIDRKNEGLGLMWKELERAQDKYIRNTEQISKWMQEITGKYHNTGRGNKKYGADQIAEWRRSRSQVEFNLTNGSIKLTPAQMMSVACLANRPQAYQHMVGAGVVVAPVGFQAKMETDLKRKSNRALPLILTDADIKLIVEQLTPEQKKMAEDLQQLMSNQMAEWGNEASMDVIGIRLFEEKDYFPIKSDRAALERDLTPDQFEQAIRNFGFTKAVQPNARNAIMIDDIFDVVTEHCNNMNLYNSYSKALNDFMKVYNKHTYQEDGSDYSVAQALGHAYSQKVPKFIMTFVQDLNGNVSRGRDTGIESMLQTQLANAKKASVFANVRVLLQQPTAITRAFAVINPKYLKGIKIERGAMDEMFEHCPIAKWKSWGYYDINMGKQIEDIIMNEGNFLEDLATQAYGAADNVTWTAIWQMVKAEMKDTHPEVEIGTDEYWNLCNERMREIVDLTQVVDSPMHRSHAMRDKGFISKSFTSFMAEPTLTFNMVRDGYIRAREAWAQGNKKEAASIMNKTMSVYVLQAAAVAAAAAIADALRGKSPDGGDDDEDKTFFASWWANTIANFQDELKLWNKVYYVKDAAGIFEGWDNKLLAYQGIESFRDGYNQMTKKLTEGSKVSWWKIYSNLFGGLGYMTGIPVKTLMKDGRAVFEALGGQLPESLVGEKKSDAVVDKGSAFGKLIAPKSSDDDKASSVVRVSEEDHWYDYGNSPITVRDGSAFDKLLNHFGLNLTKTEKAAALRSQEQKEFEQKREEIKESVLDYTGEEKAKKTWSKVTTYLKEKEGKSVNELVESGDFTTLAKYRTMFLAAGNSEEYFDSRIYDASKKALKKSIVYDATDSQINAQENIKDYLLSHGMTEAEMSDIAYRSDTARDMKVAFRLGDKELMMESLEPLVNAGLTYEDLERLWKNRNRVDLKKYDGRYKDQLKSTGNYVFPVDGIITSDFGHRSSPGGIGSTDHKGLDIGASQGTPVAAADGGVVVMAGWYGGYGKTVQVKHDDGTITQYSHLSWWDVNEGDTVAQGQEVGLVGSTGNSTGPHLHFGVLKNGEYVDPKGYIETADKKWDTSA